MDPPRAAVVGEQLARIVPVCIVAIGAWILAWREFGSVEASDWLPYALLAALVLVSALLAVRIGVPSRATAGAIAALFSLAAFDALSIAWSPVQSLARDEALLVLFYAAAFAVAALTIRSPSDRAFAVAALAFGAGGLAVATAVKLRFAGHPGDYFDTGRLDFPVSYVNAQAAAMLVGFWPAIATAARRTAPFWIRAVALGLATALLAGWLLTQSKGGALGLGVSTVVVLAVSPSRLRLLVPLAVSAALVAAGSVPLTAPIRTNTNASLNAAVRHGMTILLVLAAVGAVAGAAYALLDRRVRVPRQAERAVTRAGLAVLAAGVLGALGLLLANHPIGFVQDRWHSFKTYPKHDTAATHLVSLGSQRYDMWRVALDEFSHHPLFGIGARGFEVAYLQHRRSDEMPIRAHGLEFDTLAETGLAGAALLGLALGIPIALAARRARVELAGAAVLGAAAYFAGHAAVDWIWTFPAVGVLAFLLLGIGASSAGAAPSRRSRAALVAAGTVLILALVAFLPPWLSARYDDRAASEGGAAAASDLRWARRLDPLSTDPYVTESELAATPGAAVAPLRTAVAKAPRSYVLHYLLGTAYLRGGDRRDARDEFALAFRLDPKDPYVREAFENVRQG